MLCYISQSFLGFKGILLSYLLSESLVICGTVVIASWNASLKHKKT